MHFYAIVYMSMVWKILTFVILYALTDYPKFGTVKK